MNDEQKKPEGLRERLEDFADWLERWWVLILVLGVGVVGFLAVEVIDQGKAIKHNAHAQLVNRVANVHTWCGSIDEGRDYNRRHQAQTIADAKTAAERFDKALASLPHGQGRPVRHLLKIVLAAEERNPSLLNLKPYALPDLDCRAIEIQTLQTAGVTRLTPELRALLDPHLIHGHMPEPPKERHHA